LFVQGWNSLVYLYFNTPSPPKKKQKTENSKQKTENSSEIRTGSLAIFEGKTQAIRDAWT